MPRQVAAAVMAAPGSIEIQESPYPELVSGSMLMRTEMSGICAKNARIVGVSNHPYTKYDAALRTLDRHRDRLPFWQIVTDRHPLRDAEPALIRSTQPDPMKAVIAP